MRLGPLEIRVERARQLRERLVAIVAVATPDPVELPQPFRRGGRVGAVAGERHDPLAALLGAPQLEEAVLGRERALADDEDDALGGVDRLVDVLRPLRRGRDVLPVDPDVPAALGQERVQPADELAVEAGVRDEDVGHGPQPAASRSRATSRPSGLE